MLGHQPTSPLFKLMRSGHHWRRWSRWSRLNPWELVNIRVYSLTERCNKNIGVNECSPYFTIHFALLSLRASQKNAACGSPNFWEYNQLQLLSALLFFKGMGCYLHMMDNCCFHPKIHISQLSTQPALHIHLPMRPELVPSIWSVKDFCVVKLNTIGARENVAPVFLANKLCPISQDHTSANARLPCGMLAIF